MRGIVALVLLPIAATACSDRPEIAQCEAFILKKLKAPSTYKRITATGIGIPYESPKEYSVSIEYDAANAYGVPVRGTQICTYPLKDGRADTSAYIDFDRRFEDAARKAADEAERAAVEAFENAEREASTPAIPKPEPMAAQPEPVAMCYKDYCPCEGEQGGPDMLLCDRLEAGLPVETDMMITGRTMREARRQLAEFGF